MVYTLYYTNMLSWIFIVLAHWNSRSLVDMSLHVSEQNQSFFLTP